MTIPRPNLLIDTNILLMLVVGYVDVSLIERFKRTSDRFDQSDFRLLREYLADFPNLVTTPHVLTEVSNLLGSLKGPYLHRSRQALITLVEELLEVWEDARALVRSEYFLRGGLTDAALVEAEMDRLVVLTDDAELAAVLTANGRPVINFQHLRDAGP